MEERSTNDKNMSEKEYRELKAKYESFKIYNNKTGAGKPWLWAEIRETGCRGV